VTADASPTVAPSVQQASPLPSASPLR
jgi:hypothetical protein